MDEKKLTVLFAALVGFGVLSFLIDNQLVNLIPLIRFSALNRILIFSENLVVEIIVISIIFPIFCLAFWRKGKEKWILFLVLSLILSALLSTGLQLLFARPRPPDIALVEISFDAWEYSFPSGHSAVAFSAVPVLKKVLPRFKWIWVGLALLVALARLYLGIHYLSDVVFGSLLGYLVGLSIMELRLKYSIWK